LTKAAARGLLLLLFLLVPAGGVAAQEEPTQKIVKKIAVAGNRKVASKEILKVLRTRVGDVYNSETVDKDVGRIWGLGYFEDIDVESEDYEDGIKLTFRVKERPTISKLVFKGNRSISGSKLSEAIQIKKKDFVNPYLLKLARQRIIQTYKDEGYQFIDVKQYVKEEGKNELAVFFEISEGPKLRVKRVDFVGNKSFRSSILRGRMRTKRRRWPFQEGIYKEEDLERDLLAIRDFYKSNGWLDVRVTRELAYNDAKTELYITIHISEGPRYIVESIVIRGNELFTGQELRRRMRLKEGMPLIEDNLRRDIMTIKEMYGAQGFIDQRIKTRTPLSEEPGKIRVVFDITEGKRIFVEKIDIRGNERTRDHVIRREVTIYPGERFNTAKIRETRNRLMNTGFFESYDPLGRIAPITIETEPGSTPEQRNLVITVQEGRTGSLTFGAGISSNVGLIGQIELTQSNFDILDFPKSLEDFLSGNSFVGGGQILKLIARPGVERSEYMVSFREPSAFDSPYGFGMSGFFYQRAREFWDEERTGGTFGVDRRIGRNVVVGVTYSAESISVTNVRDTHAPQDAIDAAGNWDRLALEFRAVYDTRDYVLLPTRGVKVEATVTPVGSFLGGDIDAIEATIAAKVYRKLFEVPKWGKHIISFGAIGGIADSLNQKELPVFERMYAGGPGEAASLRGFAYRGVGPVDSVHHEQVGGRSLMLMTVEYGMPITSDAVRLVGFIDMGKVGRDPSDFGFDNLRKSAGFGLRLRMPAMGNIPIALDFAWPFDKEPCDDTQTFSFSIGGGLRF